MHKLHLCSDDDSVFKNGGTDYFEFYKLWSTSGFKFVSQKKRLCHGTDTKHKYGCRGLVPRVAGYGPKF
jgi:hypothetical protein